MNIVFESIRWSWAHWYALTAIAAGVVALATSARPAD